MATREWDLSRKREGRPRDRVQLAHVASFKLGPLSIDPALRRIHHLDGREEIVEPRVMQVLIALLGAGIVTRDELISSCWDGRIVGEDAINRVMSRLRRLADTLGEGVFRVETITKVGYRLMLASEIALQRTANAPALPGASPEAPSPAIAAPETPWVRRRAVIGGLAATALAALAPFAIKTLGDLRDRWGGYSPKPEALRLYEQGMKAQYFGLTGTTDQAEAYFRQAVEADPQWPDAWGSLAMSYRHMMDGETNVSQWRLAQQTQAAARRALQLDPDNGEALVALALIRSPMGRWQEAEASYLKLLERFPEAFVLRGHLGRLLRDVGRCADAVRHGEITRAQQPMVPHVSLGLSLAYWGAGRLHEAASEAQNAIKRWPKNPAVWFYHADFLTYSGRLEAALGFINDIEGRPTDLPPYVFNRRATAAKALLSGAGTDLQVAMGEQQQLIERSLKNPPFILQAGQSAMFFASIGDLDTVFALFEGSLFNRGRLVPAVPPAVGPLTRRDTYALFLPPLTPVRKDPRFAALIQEWGLEDYWRATRTRPDYRVAAS